METLTTLMPVKTGNGNKEDLHRTPITGDHVKNAIKKTNCSRSLLPILTGLHLHQAVRLNSVSVQTAMVQATVTMTTEIVRILFHSNDTPPDQSHHHLEISQNNTISLLNFRRLSTPSVSDSSTSKSVSK